MRPEGTRPKPSQRTRFRYLAFRVAAGAPIARNDLINRIRAAAEAASLLAIEPWLTRFNGTEGILRVVRGGETQAKRLLTGMKRDDDGSGLDLDTLGTSGTIAALRRKRLRGIRFDD